VIDLTGTATPNTDERKAREQFVLGKRSCDLILDRDAILDENDDRVRTDDGT
jgi:hypothetical protein